jgi:hypothetical protein
LEIKLIPKSISQSAVKKRKYRSNWLRPQF